MKTFFCHLVLCIVLFGLAACGGATSRVTPTVSPAPSVVPTASSTPTPSPSPTSTVEPAPSLSPEFPVNYPIEISHLYSAEISGMDIPVSIGVTQGLADRPSEPITDIQIAPDVVPLVADYFLKMCYHRYVQVEGHTDVNSYDQYLQLVADGGGQVQLAAYDGTDKDSKLILRTVDPSKGFSMVFADEPRTIKMNTLFSLYFGVNKDGKLSIVGQLPSNQVTAFKNGADTQLLVEGALSELIHVNIQLPMEILGGADNSCLVTGNYFGACQTDYVPPTIFTTYLNPLFKEVEKRVTSEAGQVFVVSQK
jgi:hypothetical protein